MEDYRFMAGICCQAANEPFAILENSNKSIDPILKPQEIPILLPEVSSTSIELQTPKVRKDMYLQIRTLASGSHDQLRRNVYFSGRL